MPDAIGPSTRCRTLRPNDNEAVTGGQSGGQARAGDETWVSPPSILTATGSWSPVKVCMPEVLQQLPAPV